MSARRRSRTPLRPPAGPVELTLTGFTHGAEAVGRRPDGKVCFVAHALPGERVLVAIEAERSSWSRGRLLEIITASPDRVEPPCPYAGPGKCGGCALQHIRPARQADLLRQVIVDQLERIGHLRDPPVKPTRRPHAPGASPPQHPTNDTARGEARNDARTRTNGQDGTEGKARFFGSREGLGYRTRARFSVDPEGRLGFHRHATHEVIPIDRCRLLTDAAHAARQEAGDQWASCESVTVRAGDDGTGVIEVRPGAGVLDTVPGGDRAVVLVDELAHAHALREGTGGSAVHHIVKDVGFRVSATSFFQPSPEGAAMLVEEVLDGARVRPGDQVLDLYAGVGLFSWFLAAAGGQVTAYESHPVAVQDALHNLSGLSGLSGIGELSGSPGSAGPEVEVVQSDAHRGVVQLIEQDARVDTVVLDPPRQGAGEQVCSDLARLRASRIVYVACDPAALARDARILVGAGFRLVRVVPIDQFTHTGHIEAVATFHRG